MTTKDREVEMDVTQYKYALRLGAEIVTGDGVISASVARPMFWLQVRKLEFRSERVETEMLRRLCEIDRRGQRAILIEPDEMRARTGLEMQAWTVCAHEAVHRVQSVVLSQPARRNFVGEAIQGSIYAVSLQLLKPRIIERRATSLAA